MPKITGIVFGGGAFESGVIRVGDEIVKVNGQRVRDMPTVDVRRLLKGPEGSKVEMQVCTVVKLLMLHRSKTPVTRTHLQGLYI